MESDVYTPSRGIKACWRYHSTDAYIRDLQPTWLVVLGLLGMLNPSPTRYYDTPNEFCKLIDYV